MVEKMKKRILTIMLMIVFLGSSAISTGAAASYTNYARGDTTITIDGEIGDWADVESVAVTLKPARVTADANASISANFYSTHDATKIYFLVEVTDDYYFYDINTCAVSCQHRYAPALGLAFPIDDGAMVEYMGGSGRDTLENIELVSGEVDMLHWELDTVAGDLAGGTKNSTTGASFGDGVGNLDDEWAKSVEDRHDDNDATTSENSYSGSWGFSAASPTNGTAGNWYFEISRDLDTGDIHDAQFAEGETIDVAIAYWTPNEQTNNKWTNDGHYVNYDNVIQMSVDAATGETTTSDDPTSKDDDEGFLPGFSLIIAFSGIFVMATILKKRN